MRYSKNIQAIADRFAREHGYIAATYTGVYMREYIAFLPKHLSSRDNYSDRNLAFILIGEDLQAEFIRNQSREYKGSYDILRQTMTYPLWRKGMRIIKEYQERQHGYFFSETDRQYTLFVASMTDPESHVRKDLGIELHDLCVGIELAERLHMHLTVDRDQNGYFLRLTH